MSIAGELCTGMYVWYENTSITIEATLVKSDSMVIVVRSSV